MDNRSTDAEYLQEIAAIHDEHEAAIAMSAVFPATAAPPIAGDDGCLSEGHIFSQLPLMPDVDAVKDCRKIYHDGIVSYHMGGRLARVKFTNQPLDGYKPGTTLVQSPGDTARWLERDPYHPGPGRVYRSVEKPGYKVVRHVRGIITAFSHKSRLRCLQKTAMIDTRHAALPLFVTLTWHENWPDELACKALLRAFLHRLGRQWGKAPVMWKLEWQRRGAPHFHLLYYHQMDDQALAEFRFWVALTWNRLCYPWVRGDDGVDRPSDIEHYRVLLHHDAAHPEQDSVQRVGSWRGVLAYAAKYVAKPSEDGYVPDAAVGRFWGVWHWKLQPITVVRAVVSYDLAMMARRWLRKLGRRGARPGRRVGARRRRRMVADGNAPPSHKMPRWSWLWGAWSFCADSTAARMLAYLDRYQGHTESPDQSDWTDPGLWRLPVCR